MISAREWATGGLIMNFATRIGAGPVGVGTAQPLGLIKRVFTLLNRRIFLLLIFALFALCVALMVEQLTAPLEPTHRILSASTLSELLREIAFAFLIAFAIIATVELESREEREQKAEDERINFMRELTTERDEFAKKVDQKLVEISQNVFWATFERQIPKRIVDELNLLVFSSDFVRTDHHQTLTLRNINATDLDQNFAHCDLVELIVEADYVVRNVSAIAKPFYIKMSGEKPPDKALHKHLKLELLSVWLDGARINAEVESKDMDDEHTTARVWKINDIKPQNELKIMTRQTLIKYPNDYEVWRSVYPTCGLKFTVEFPEQVRSFDAKALHREPLIPQELNPRKFDYLLNGPLLPHQGVLVWWCCKPTGLDEKHSEGTHAIVG
jgi:hypothetical protein